jgi:photosystem II stability/assembly factor-like uncharacterized protein
MKRLFFTTLFISMFSLHSFSQWNIIYTPNPAQTMYALRFYNTNTGYVTSVLYNSSNFNIYKTTNGGTNWTAQNSGRTAMRFNDIYIFHPDTVFMVGNYGCIIKTVNGGLTWDSAGLGNTASLYGIDFINNNTGFVVGDNGTIWKTTNKGGNWTLTPPPVAAGFNRVLFVNQTTGFLVASANYVYKTTDAGASWFNLNFPSIGTFDFLREVVFTDQNTGYITADVGRVRKTTNGGVNWTLLTTPTTEALFSIDYANANVLYACGGAGKVIKTTDAGNTWTLQQTSLNEYLYGMDITSSDTGYICAWSGKILKTVNGGGITSIDPISSVAAEYKLEQNYPNPFNPNTIIRFQIRDLRFVKLRVLDVLGKEVETLVNGNLKAGTYEVKFDGENLANGIYFYRLQSGNFTDTKKMILIK